MSDIPPATRVFTFNIDNGDLTYAEQVVSTEAIKVHGIAVSSTGWFSAGSPCVSFTDNDDAQILQVNMVWGPDVGLIVEIPFFADNGLKVAAGPGGAALILQYGTSINVFYSLTG